MKEKVKEQLDIWEKILTIVVSLIAIYGTVAAYQNDFFHKVARILNHYHQKVEKIEAGLEIEL